MFFRYVTDCLLGGFSQEEVNKTILQVKRKRLNKPSFSTQDSNMPSKDSKKISHLCRLNTHFGKKYDQTNLYFSRKSV